MQRSLRISQLPGMLLAFILLASFDAAAQVPITLYNNFSGKVDFTVIGGTLRSASNATNPCAVKASSAYTLSLPSGATLVAAYLYWAGSYSTASGSTQTIPDYAVTLDGNSVSATRTFTEVFSNGGTDYPFFSGFADVTSYVLSQPNNHSYVFSGLSVNTGTPHCAVQAVAAGWSMVVVYTLPSLLRHSINIYDGFRYFRGGTITFSPANFYVPYGQVNGKLTHITWEGDAENSASLNGVSENLSFNGSILSDAINPVNNQFNSASSALSPSANTYGVDIDSYDVTAYLRGGDTVATTTYASGGDMVLLNCEVVSIADTSSSDVQIVKTHAGGNSVVAGNNLTYTLAVVNNGPDTTGTITVTDSLPAGARFVSATAPGWSIDSTAKPKFIWRHTGAHAPGVALPNISITAIISTSNYPTLYNTASASSPQFDRRPWNNSSTDSITVLTPIFLQSTKTVSDPNGGSVRPKDTLNYTIKIKNTGNYAAPNVAVIDTMPSGVNVIPSSILPGGALSGSIITFNTMSSVAIGDSATLTYKAIVDSTVVGGQSISNVAHVQSLTIDQSVTAAVTPVNQPAMTVAKSSLPGPRRALDTLTYRIVIRNGSSVTVSAGTTVLDTIPLNMTYVAGSVTGGGVFSTPPARGLIQWNLGTRTGGAVDTLTYKAFINNGTAVNTILTNTARLSNNQGTSLFSAVNDTVRQYMTGILTATASIVPGDTVYYTLQDADLNTLSGTIETVTLKDSNRTGETENLIFTETGANTGIFAAKVPTVFGLTAGANNNGIFNVKAGDTLTIIYNDARTNAGTAARTTAITVVRGGATATLTATQLIAPGDSIYYTLTDADLNKNALVAETCVLIDSSKTGEKENVTFTETGPNTGIFTARIPTGYGASAGPNNDGRFNAKAGDTIYIKYIDQLQTNGGSGSLLASTAVRGGVTATISVSPAIVAPGSALIFTIADNDMNRDTSRADTIRNVSVSSTGETELLTFIETGRNSGNFTMSISTVQGSTPGPNNNGVFTVQPGDTLSVSYVDSLTSTGSTAVIKASSAVGRVLFTQSAKTFADVNGGVQAQGDTLRYAILVKNTGNATAANVAVRDTLPAGITVVPGSITGGGSQASNIISFAGFSLSPGDSLILRFTVTIDSTVVDSSLVTNVALIAANSSSQLVSVGFRASNRPQMAMTKTVDKLTPTVGDTIVYTITYANVGTNTAANVVVTDTIPSRTTYIPNSVLLNASSQTDAVDGDQTQFVSGVIRVTVTQLRVNQSGIIRFKVKIN